MGVIMTTLILANPSQPQLAPLTVEALVDTGALHLCLPEAVRLQLALEEIDRRVVSLADGRQVVVPYVGPVTIRVATRVGVCGALVLGDTVLLGAIPREDLDLIIVPRTKRLDVNPESPNIGRSLAK